MEKETLTVHTDEHGTITYRNDSGELHNPDGPAIVYSDGEKWYCINGQLHNTNGPAIIWADCGLAHYIHGDLHNPDGPAVIGKNGYKAYYIKGKKLTEAEFAAWQTQQAEK